MHFSLIVFLLISYVLANPPPQKDKESDPISQFLQNTQTLIQQLEQKSGQVFQHLQSEIPKYKNEWERFNQQHDRIQEEYIKEMEQNYISLLATLKDLLPPNEVEKPKSFWEHLRESITGQHPKKEEKPIWKVWQEQIRNAASLESKSESKSNERQLKKREFRFQEYLNQLLHNINEQGLYFTNRFQRIYQQSIHKIKQIYHQTIHPHFQSFIQKTKTSYSRAKESTKRKYEETKENLRQFYNRAKKETKKQYSKTREQIHQQYHNINHFLITQKNKQLPKWKHTFQDFKTRMSSMKERLEFAQLLERFRYKLNGEVEMKSMHWEQILKVISQANVKVPEGVREVDQKEEEVPEKEEHEEQSTELKNEVKHEQVEAVKEQPEHKVKHD